jgi:hypothetical protein
VISCWIFSFFEPWSFSVFLFICINNKVLTCSCCFNFLAKRTVASPDYDSGVKPVLIGSFEIIFYWSRSSAYINYIRLQNKIDLYLHLVPFVLQFVI